MSNEALGNVWRHSTYEGTQLVIQLAIADIVNDVYNNEFWMSNSRLAAKARCVRGTASTAVQKMVEDGWLELLEAEPGTARRYRFILAEGARSDDRGGARSDDRGGARSDDTPCAIQDSSPLTIPREPNTPMYVEEFEEAWGHYPRKLGKQAAYKAYLATIRRGGKRKPSDLLSAVLGYAHECKRNNTEQRFMKHASTFFGPTEPWVDYVGYDKTGIVGEPTITERPEKIIDPVAFAKMWVDYDETGHWTLPYSNAFPAYMGGPPEHHGFKRPE